jgi:hypothetical protein
MNPRRCVVTVGLMSALWLPSCAQSYTVSPGEARCRRLCEESRACLTPEQSRRLDCYTSCDDLEGVNRANDCFEEVDAFYDCIEKHGVCNPNLAVECVEREDVYSDCIADQCSTDPDRDVCF